MKKFLSLMMLSIFIYIGFATSSRFSTPIYGWLEISKIAFVAVVDATAKMAQRTVNSKGGSRTETYPRPGYDNSDKYWNFDDLEGHFEEYRDEYTFLNENPPNEAIASLPSNTADRYSNGFDTGVIASIQARSTHSPAIKFPWDEKKHLLMKGDIVFTRANTAFSNAAQFFTSWVHAGMVKDVDFDETYESFYPGGVKTYNPKNDWPEGYSWSVKRVKPSSLSRSQIEKAVDDAEFFYDRKPYFPEHIVSYKNRGDFVAEFADKNNTSSFYCTKLVWKAFEWQGIDLDSERTTAKVDNNFFHGYTDWGASNKWAWIGVSGDDIYYSKHLSEDIWSYGLDNLVVPLSEWL